MSLSSCGLELWAVWGGGTWRAEGPWEANFEHMVVSRIWEDGEPQPLFPGPSLACCLQAILLAH